MASSSSSTTATTGGDFKTLMSLEFPGVVNNMDRLMKMVGGKERLEDTFNSTVGSRLQLRLRPEDVYCHPVHGDLVPVQDLLVRFSRRRLTFDDGSVEEVTSARVVGVIESSFTFTSLCDFQYLPMTRSDAPGRTGSSSVGGGGGHPKYISIRDSVIPDKDPFNVNVSLNEKEFNASAPIFILPTIFSRFDSVNSDYCFKNGPEFRDKDKREMLESQIRSKSLIGKVRKSRCTKAHTVSLAQSQAVPEEASQEMLDTFQCNAAGGKELKSKIESLFNERPIWTKNGLLLRLGCHFRHQDLKNILPVLAYHCTDGAWKHSWIRFKYDPRQEPESRSFQVMDFRMRKTYYNKKIEQHLKSSSNKTRFAQYSIPLQKNRLTDVRSSSASLVSSAASLASISSASTSHDQEEREAKRLREVDRLTGQVFFKPNQIPSNRQLVLQLVDIELEIVKELIQPEPKTSTPDSKDGWLEPGSMDKIRSCMKRTVDQVVIDLAQDKGWMDREQATSLLDKLLKDDTTSLTVSSHQIQVLEEEDVVQDEDDDDSEDSEGDESTLRAATSSSQ